MSRKLTLVAGARPNFMKIAPIVRALDRAGPDFSYRLVHTGQHYDEAMNAVFFRELGIPEPDAFLGAGGGSHAEQTAKIMIGFERDCIEHPTDMVVVVGDVNSTLACSIVAKKLHIPVAHVEAGLRSGDRRMPEEINRLVTDAIADWFFVTEPAGAENLLREGRPPDRIHHVGHVMVDNALYEKAKLEALAEADFASSKLKAGLGRYAVVTLHRPSNVDDPDTFRGIARALATLSEDIPLIFPVHPRTLNTLRELDLALGSRVHLLPPLPYLEFMNLWKDAVFVLTDSGGLQEETTALGVPCVTARENTERPVTVEQGTNTLAGADPENILREARAILSGKSKTGRRPELWDGHAADRIVNVLQTAIATSSRP